MTNFVYRLHPNIAHVNVYDNSLSADQQLPNAFFNDKGQLPCYMGIEAIEPGDESIPHISAIDLESHAVILGTDILPAPKSNTMQQIESTGSLDLNDLDPEGQEWLNQVLANAEIAIDVLDPSFNNGAGSKSPCKQAVKSDTLIVLLNSGKTRAYLLYEGYTSPHWQNDRMPKKPGESNQVNALINKLHQGKVFVKGISGVSKIVPLKKSVEQSEGKPSLWSEPKQTIGLMMIQSLDIFNQAQILYGKEQADIAETLGEVTNFEFDPVFFAGSLLSVLAGTTRDRSLISLTLSAGRWAAVWFSPYMSSSTPETEATRKAIQEKSQGLDTKGLQLFTDHGVPYYYYSKTDNHSVHSAFVHNDLLTSEKDFNIFVATIYGEAGSAKINPDLTWKAVASVIVNRIGIGYWKSCKTGGQVVSYPGAFDAYIDPDHVNFNALKTEAGRDQSPAWQGYHEFLKAYDFLEYEGMYKLADNTEVQLIRQVRDAVKGIYFGSEDSITEANYYYSPDSEVAAYDKDHKNPIVPPYATDPKVQLVPIAGIPTDFMVFYYQVFP